MRVLLVEDDEMIGRSLKQALEGAGWSADWVRDGELAQSALGSILWLAIVFFILAIVAFMFGANGVAGMSAGIGRTLMFVFLVLAIILLIFNFVPHA